MVGLNHLKSIPHTITGRIVGIVEVIRRIALETPDIKPGHGKVQWMLHVRVLVEKIIAPDSVDWMEDDISMSRSSYITRALSDVRNRFERSVLSIPNQFEAFHIQQ